MPDAKEKEKEGGEGKRERCSPDQFIAMFDAEDLGKEESIEHPITEVMNLDLRGRREGKRRRKNAESL